MNNKVKKIQSNHPCLNLCDCCKETQPQPCQQSNNSIVIKKLSLKRHQQKKSKEQLLCESMKNLGRQPITERPHRTYNETEQKLAHLIEMKSQVQAEINELKNNFDHYYQVYQKKIKQLKLIEAKFNLQHTDRVNCRKVHF